MKKLILLIAMLMATSAWGEIINLSCYTEAAEVIGGADESGDFRTTLSIDTENKTVTGDEFPLIKYSDNSNNSEINFYYDKKPYYEYTYTFNKLSRIIISFLPVDSKYRFCTILCAPPVD